MTKTDPTRRALAALAAVSTVLLVPACGEADEGTEAVGEPGGQTLAAMLAADSDLSLVSDTFGDAGLAEVFDGTAAYTFMAPTDAAFDALGEAGDDLRSPEQRAAMVAILRDHIVPGYLTPGDISRAIELSDDKRVELRTMGARTLVFTAEGDQVVVTAEDGASAQLGDDVHLASNGVAIPLDGVLKRVVPPEA